MSVGLCFAALAGWLLVYVDATAFDAPFADQFDLWGWLLERRSAIELFTIQHGPHRQGLGFLITRWVYDATDWNVRAEAFVIAATLIAASAGWLQVRRAWGRLAVHDIVIPIVALSPVQFETIVVTPNISHSVLPFALCALTAWLIAVLPAGWLGLAAGTVGGVLLFTGFGYCALPGLVLAVGLTIARERTPAAARRPADRWSMVGAGAGLLLLGAFACWFARGYVPQSAIENWRWLDDQPENYVWFVVRVHAALLGFRGDDVLTYAVGAGAAVSSVTVAVAAIFRLWSGPAVDRRLWAVVLFCAATSLTFAAATAVGRAPLGLEAARASRYTTFMLLGLLAIHLAGQTVRRRRPEAIWPACVAVLLIVFFAANMGWPWRLGERFRDLKETWYATYDRTGSVEQADRTAGRAVYGPPAPQLPASIEIIRARRLSRYRHWTPPPARE